MKEPSTSTADILVQVVQPGVGPSNYHLAEGSTLGDLLRLCGHPLTDEAVLIDGLPPAESVVLHDGAIVTIVHSTRGHEPGNEPWRARIPAFQDDALFREYMEILKTRRQQDNTFEDPDA